MMAIYECVVILFMTGFCWSRALYPATEATETLDSQRGGWSVVEERSCPTWYREIKRNGVTRCACGAMLRGTVVCDDAARETLLIAGLCMSYDDTMTQLLEDIHSVALSQCSNLLHHALSQMILLN